MQVSKVFRRVSTATKAVAGVRCRMLVPTIAASNVQSHKLAAVTAKATAPIRALATNSHAGGSRGNNDGAVYAPLSFFKAKGALDAQPVPARFVPTVNNLSTRLERAGALKLSFSEPVANSENKTASGGSFRRYDRTNSGIFQLSVTEIGDLINFHRSASATSLSWQHDPSLGTERAGAVRKSLTIQRLPPKEGFKQPGVVFFSFAATTTATNVTKKIGVPLTEGEFTTLVIGAKGILPSLLGFPHAAESVFAAAPGSTTPAGAAAPIVDG